MFNGMDPNMLANAFPPQPYGFQGTNFNIQQDDMVNAQLLNNYYPQGFMAQFGNQNQFGAG